jgi:phosphoglycolate phosphatase-like HAD superfamily hydrolase
MQQTSAMLVVFDLDGTLVDSTRALLESHEALAAAYSRAYVKMANRYERLFDGMAELMARPFRAAVATGKSQRGAERAVNQHGLGDRFEIVLGADSVPRPKPNPDVSTSTASSSSLWLSQSLKELISTADKGPKDSEYSGHEVSGGGKTTPVHRGPAAPPPRSVLRGGR